MKKWIISPNGRPNIASIDDVEADILFEDIRRNIGPEELSWDSEHVIHQYNNVFSITDDSSTCAALTKGISKSVKTVFIPGCGSNPNLQKYIVQNYPTIETIYCTDWSQNAINQAAKKFSHKKIRYRREDTSALSFEANSIDNVIISNSILSGFDLQNRKMIHQCHRVLKRGGLLCGFFPTIHCALEFSFLDRRFAHWLTDGTIDLSKNSFYEVSQKTSQIFYSPLRLNQIFQEVGFHRKAFEIYFFDDEYFRMESERIYGLPPDSGLYVWEILAVLEK